jgi:hypothetical protein
MNWDSPTERLALIERVGIDEYNRLHEENEMRNTIGYQNRRAIVQVHTQFGRLFRVGDTGRAFSTYTQACDYADTLPRI